MQKLPELHFKIVVVTGHYIKRILTEELMYCIVL
jgi:hypothetical protein